jgi:hypothetical protein
MIESWNNGRMGSGIRQYWLDDKNGEGDKIKMDICLLIRHRGTSIPPFQYSISGQERRPKKCYIF